MLSHVNDLIFTHINMSSSHASSCQLLMVITKLEIARTVHSNVKWGMRPRRFTLHSSLEMTVQYLLLLLQWMPSDVIYLFDPLFVQFIKQHLKGLSLNVAIMWLQRFLLSKQNDKNRANRNCKRIAVSVVPVHMNLSDLSYRTSLYRI